MSSRIETESAPVGGRITIDDLAERTGMTVRNIRAHQSRGLLDPPVVVGRTGYYDDEHIGRIALIRELQEEGFNLEAIRRILDSVGGSSADLLDFTRTVREPYETEQPEILEAAEIAAAFGDTDLNAEYMRRVEVLGLMRAIGEGRYEVLSPKLYEVGVRLAGLGVSPDEALDMLERLKARSSAVAELFISVFMENVWQPFDEAGRPREDWPRVRETLTRMRPLASEAFVASLQIAMEEASERAISEGIRRDIGKASDSDRS